MLQDQRGALWLGLYGQGLAKLEDGKFLSTSSRMVSLMIQVMALLEDREGNIWIGTQGGGVSKFAGERFVNYTSAQGLARGLIHAIAQDSKGNFWFGSLAGGLCKFDGKHFTQLTTNQGLLHDQVEDILIDSKDRVYVATDGGLSILEDGQFRNYTTKMAFPVTSSKLCAWIIKGNCGLALLKEARFDLMANTSRAIRLTMGCSTTGSAVFGKIVRDESGSGLTRESPSSKAGFFAVTTARTGWVQARLEPSQRIPMARCGLARIPG